MKQKSVYSLLLAGVITLSCMFAGCSEEMPVEVSSSPITFVIDDVGGPDGAMATRGVKITSLSSIGVSASVCPESSSYSSVGCGSYFFNQSVTPGVALSYCWPTADYRLSSFAYYPYGNAAFTVQSAASASGAPTYSYTVPSAIGSQLDVMTGQDVNRLGGGSTPISLTMKHRCAAICFSVTNSRSSAITLTSISIEGVKYTGTLNEETWTLTNDVNSSSSNPFTLSYGSSIAASATANVTGTTNIFLMLPQTIPAGAKVKVVIEGEDPMYADLSGTWIAGRQYNYGLSVTNSNISLVIDEDSDIEDWAMYKEGAFIYDINGNFYSSAEWTTEKSAGRVSDSDVVGIAVISGEHRFLIGLSNYTSINMNSSNVVCATIEQTSGIGLDDFDGKNNTENILKTYTNTNSAPYRATHTYFKNGNSGYLPGRGEQRIANENATQVDACLAACGGAAMLEGTGYWSSTYWGWMNSYAYFAAKRWHVDEPDEMGYGVTTSRNARFFAHIEQDGGVYVYATNGKLYGAEQWTAALSAGTVSNDDVVGIAVITSTMRFVMATDALSGTYYIYNDNTKALTFDSSKIWTDGEYNTEVMIQPENYTSSTDWAAGLCHAYTFKNGKHGYLPAYNQLDAVYNNKTAVNTCLTAVGKSGIINDNCWTSTDAGVNDSGYIRYYLYNPSTGTSAKGNPASWKRIIPFCTLD